MEKIEAEESVSRVLHVACGELVELLDATFASVSRVIGDLLVELSGYRRDGGEHPLELFLVTDYPLTQEVIEIGEARVVRRVDPGADPAEAALLQRLGFDSLLMLPLRSHGRAGVSSRSTRTTGPSPRTRSRVRRRSSTASASCSPSSSTASDRPEVVWGREALG